MSSACCGGGPGEHHIRRGLHDVVVGEGGMTDKPTLLLEHHLKELKPESTDGRREGWQIGMREPTREKALAPLGPM